MRIKKWLVALVALTLAFSALFGCGKGGENPGPGGDENPPAPPVTDPAGNTYVDPVGELMGRPVYNGMGAYLDQSRYGAFEDIGGTALPDETTLPLDEALGFVHAGGQYNFTTLPYLSEGAGVVEKDLGSKTIKLWLSREMPDQYSFHHNWTNSAGTLADLAKDGYVKEVFGAGFTTLILVTYEYERVEWDKQTDMTADELRYVEGEFYGLTKELMRAYNTTGKTFVLQNWEGDNELTPALEKLGSGGELTADKRQVIDNYLAYSNARQAGIAKARAEVDSDVEVYGALEINFISSNYGGQPKLIDHVVPHSAADLFSFSDWSTDNVNLARDLRTLKAAAPENNPLFGENNFYLGEYGRAENLSGAAQPDAQLSYSTETMKIALSEGARYVCYWALNCNERVGGTTTRPSNADMKGYWLIRPDGHYTDTFWYYKGLLDNKNYLASPPKLVLRLPEPEPEPIPFVEEDIIFFDNFDDVGLDGPDISRNKKMEGYSSGMRYDVTRERDRPLFRQYLTKYNLDESVAFTTVQKKENTPSEEYIQYKVERAPGQKTAKLVIQGFLYDPTPKSILKITASRDGTNFEPVKAVYVMDKAGTYGYLYVTAELSEAYQSVRVVFTNAKAGNTWDPLLCRLAFLK